MSAKSDTVTTSLPNRGQATLIVLIVLLLVLALALTAPHADRPTIGTENLLPAYAAAGCVIEITTATLLLAIFRVRRSISVLVLAFGYLLSGTLLPAWALAFPGIFDAFGWTSDLQATAWIAAVRRVGFALAVVGFAVLDPERQTNHPVRWISLCLLAVGAALVAGLSLTMVDVALPTLMLDARLPAQAWDYVPPLTIGLYVVGIAALLHRRRSSLDIWMAVVLLSLMTEIVLLSYAAGGVRLSVGWWAGRMIGLFSAATILIVLLSETAGNYMRLAEAAASEMRARRNRLTAMEALSATIAHEINQPLTSIVTNAGAGLRWLSRDVPNAEQASEALSMIAEDGHRAAMIVAGIRTMFLKGAQERGPVDIRMLVEDALSRCQAERSLPSTHVRLVFPKEDVFVECNAVQILQVCMNIIENAVGGSDGVSDATRRLIIRVERDGPEDMVETSILDDGPGVPPELAERMFEPFFSTKPDGMGMGLMFCRSVIEAHGGRLWFTENRPRGAAFHFTLPSSRSPVRE